MKWIALVFIAIAGAHAVSSDAAYEIPDDGLVTKACGTDPACIRRHNLARRIVLGAHREIEHPVEWTPACPTVSWIAFQACFDASRK